MIDLRLHRDALIYRIWQHDAEYFGTLGLAERHEGYVRYTNPGLRGRYDPNHAGMLRLEPKTMHAAIRSIITHYDTLGMDSVVYLDGMHQPADLAAALQESGFIPMLEWGQYDLMALRGDVNMSSLQAALTHPNTAAEYGQWAELREPDAYSDAATMAALRFTECSSPAVVPTIIWCDGEPAGRCLSFVQDGVGRIECVYVEPRFRRRGLARAMVAQVAADICTVGALPYLFAAHNSDAQRIYETIGFETILTEAVMTHVRPHIGAHS